MCPCDQHECVKAQFYFSAAYKKADGMKIDGRRVLVDVERARTVKGWLPRRLGEKQWGGKKAKHSSGYSLGSKNNFFFTIGTYMSQSL